MCVCVWEAVSSCIRACLTPARVSWIINMNAERGGIKGMSFGRISLKFYLSVRPRVQVATKELK
jgi:hypothetical protein